MKIDDLMHSIKQVDTVKLVLTGVGATSYDSEEIYKLLENQEEKIKNLREERDRYAVSFFKSQERIIDYSDRLIAEKKKNLTVSLAIIYCMIFTFLVSSYWFIEFIIWAMK